MATQAEAIDLDEDFEEDAPDLNLDVDDDDQQGDPDPDEDHGADEQQHEADVITFGERSVEAEEDSEGLRNIRLRLREVERENKALKAAQAPAVEDLGEEPNPDDYWDNPEGLKQAIRDYDKRKAAAEERTKQQREVADAVEREIADSQTTFDRQRASLKVANFDGAYDKVTEKIGDTGAKVLSLVAGEKSAALAYALGNSADRLEALGKFNLNKITDLVRFAAEIGGMAKAVEVNRNRKPATQPESVQRGSSGGGGGGDRRRAALEAKAMESGNFTDLVAYDAKRSAR